MKTPNSIAWTVDMSSKARKQTAKLPQDITDALLALWADLKACGPVQPAWPHYGKLKGRKDEYHCHLNKGKSTFVAVWRCWTNRSSSWR